MDSGPIEVEAERGQRGLVEIVEAVVADRPGVVGIVVGFAGVAVEFVWLRLMGALAKLEPKEVDRLDVLAVEIGDLVGKEQR